MLETTAATATTPETNGAADTTQAGTDATNTIVATIAPALTASDFTKFTWYLYGVGNGPAGLMPWTPDISLHFTSPDAETLAFSIDAGCNVGTGHFQLGSDAIMTVIDIELTHQICVPDDEAAIGVIVGVFAQPMRWSFAGPALTLTAATGTKTALEWRQTPDGTPATEPSTS